MVDYRNILVEKLEYDNFMLYVHCMVFYNKSKDFENYNYDIYQKKIFKFKNIKKFQYYADEQYFSFYDEIKELKKELGIKCFLKVFYRSKKKNKIYICDQTEHFTVIEFNDNKKWNYRKQIK